MLSDWVPLPWHAFAAKVFALLERMEYRPERGSCQRPHHIPTRVIRWRNQQAPIRLVKLRQDRFDLG
eukprot:9133503-Prorocentrum_lima.AAC.1